MNSNEEAIAQLLFLVGEKSESIDDILTHFDWHNNPELKELLDVYIKELGLIKECFPDIKSIECREAHAKLIRKNIEPVHECIYNYSKQSIKSKIISKLSDDVINLIKKAEDELGEEIEHLFVMSPQHDGVRHMGVGKKDNGSLDELLKMYLSEYRNKNLRKKLLVGLLGITED